VSDDLVTFQLQDLGGRSLVRLAGEIDLSNIDQLQERLERIIEDSRGVVLDLTEIVYLDSQGLRLIKRLQDTAAAAGGTFAVVAPAGSFSRQALELSHLDEYVMVEDEASRLAHASDEPGG
jgi:anti-anti-sigma factor